MRARLLPLLGCCLASAICFGQWSDPAPLLNGSPFAEEQSLVAGAGDTIWAVVALTAPPGALACWTTGDTWSQPTELAPPDSNPVFHDPAMGRDASGRMWAAWYKDSNGKGVWTAFRDSAGWHAPAGAYSGDPAAGPMSFAADKQGNWYLGFATLTPYAKGTYSSAVYCRLAGDSWQPPRYIAQGTSNPFETDFYAPKLVTKPDSGLWAIHEMSLGSSSRVTMMRIVQPDTARWHWTANGTNPAATADSAGQLWVLYSELAMYWLSAQVIVDSSPVDTVQIADIAGGPACVTTDPEGWVWAAWPIKSSQRVVVNYGRGMDWSSPEAASDSNCAPLGIAADANGRVYVLFKTADGRLYSTYRTSRPGVLEHPTGVAAASRPPTITRGVLFLPTSLLSPPSSLYALDGRRALELHAGANDVSALSPGVYFLRRTSGVMHGAPRVSKVIVTK
jgi:hypothetical protein